MTTELEALLQQLLRDNTDLGRLCDKFVDFICRAALRNSAITVCLTIYNKNVSMKGLKKWYLSHLKL